MNRFFYLKKESCMIKMTEQEIMREWNLKDSLSVSICCITYNHEKYISEAIDGFLMQRTTFPFEIIIGEDCSTDDTLKIINAYKSKYPNLIRVLTNDINIGMQKNFKNTFSACNGTYIALCEGDDFWTDVNKLQKQVGFLEENSQFAICCHKSENYDANAQTVTGYFPETAQDLELTIFDLFDANIAHTCTFVYRNQNIRIPLFFENLQMADWPLHMIHAGYGKIKVLSENMAIYRVHQSGVWSSTTAIQQLDASIVLLNCMNDFFQKKYSVYLQKSITRYILEKALIFLDLKQFVKARLCYEEYRSYKSINFLYASKYFIKKNLSFCYSCIAHLYRIVR